VTPGEYLRRRRLAAGLQLDALVCGIACSPRRRRPVTGADLPRIEARLRAAESDAPPLPLSQAELLVDHFAFDLGVYEQLLRLRSGQRLDPPRLCRGCACSVDDACLDPAGACAWAEEDLCTACAERAALCSELAEAFDWPDAPLPNDFPRQGEHP